MSEREFKSCIKEDLELYMDYCAGYMKTPSCSIRRGHLLSFDRFLTRNEANGAGLAEEITQGWINSLKGSLASRTIQSYSCSLRQFLNFYRALHVANVYIPPLHRYSGNYIPYLFSGSEMDKIYEIADNYPCGQGNTLPFIKAELPVVIRILHGCGTRVAEILQLKTRDIDFDSGVLTLRKTKNDEERQVPMAESLAIILRQYCEMMGLSRQEDSYVFPRRTTADHLTVFDISYRFNRILRIAGIIGGEKKDGGRAARGPCLYCLRHGFAVEAFRRLEKQGISVTDGIPYLSVYMEHSGIEATGKYLVFPAEMFPEELEKFEAEAATLMPDDSAFDEWWG